MNGYRIQYHRSEDGRSTPMVEVRCANGGAVRARLVYGDDRQLSEVWVEPSEYGREAMAVAALVMRRV